MKSKIKNTQYAPKKSWMVWLIAWISLNISIKFILKPDLYKFEGLTRWKLYFNAIINELNTENIKFQWAWDISWIVNKKAIITYV